MQVYKANGLGYWSTSQRQHDGEAIHPENKPLEICGDQDSERQGALSTLRVRLRKCKKQV
jgi:hypothetical protein